MEHDFEVILGQAVPCCKLRWICSNHSNGVARQVETQGNSTIFVVRPIHSAAQHYFLVAWRLRFTMILQQRHFSLTTCELLLHAASVCAAFSGIL